MTELWEPLGRVAPEALAGARRLAHWAAQLPAAFGRGLLPPQPDLSHLALAWDPHTRILWSGAAPLGGHAPVHAGLRLATLELCFGEARGKLLDHHPLVGATLEEGLLWLEDLVEQRGGEDPARRLELPEEEPPEHPVGLGERFPDADPAAFAELESWVADAALVLEELRREEEGATRVRTWPEHFDTALLLRGPAGGRIGVGLSPGDGDREAPYWYVTPAGSPAAAALPPLPAGGRWHRGAWIGALLGAEDLEREPSAQRGQVEAFLAGAIRAVRALREGS